MAYEVAYKQSVTRDLKSIPAAQARRVLARIETVLAARPEANPALKGRFAGLRRLRVGDYRVIYAVLDRTVLVLRIGHRKDVYRG